MPKKSAARSRVKPAAEAITRSAPIGYRDLSRGTGSSNPSPSSGESRANLTSSIRALKFAKRDGAVHVAPHPIARFLVAALRLGRSSAAPHGYRRSRPEPNPTVGCWQDKVLEERGARTGRADGSQHIATRRPARRLPASLAGIPTRTMGTSSQFTAQPRPWLGAFVCSPRLPSAKSKPIAFAPSLARRRSTQVEKLPCGSISSAATRAPRLRGA